MSNKTEKHEEDKNNLKTNQKQQKNEQTNEQTNKLEAKHLKTTNTKTITKMSNETEKQNENTNKQQINNAENKIENVPKTYQILICLNDYFNEENEKEEDKTDFCLDEGQCVEVLDNTNPKAWLVRTKVKRFFFNIK
jgi:hypothetical protein